MFYNLKKKFQFALFDFKIKSLLNTKPIVCDKQSDVVCVSHVGTTYLYAYLLAVKSLARFIPLKKIIVVDDLSMTEKDKQHLQQHVIGIDIRPITSMPNPNCPSGGDWEGFLSIGQEVKNHFCILLDADTVTVREIPEVIDSIRSNRSFTLGTWKDQSITSIHEACKNVVSQTSQHVQILAEKSLAQLPDAERLQYVRGCGGFAGFAKGKDFRSEIESFSEAMVTLIGREKWAEWGSQQVASNYFIANTPEAVILPFPKYVSFAPTVNTQESSFIHFIGSHRFEDGTYARVAKDVIRSL